MPKSYSTKYFMSRLKKLRVTVSRSKGWQSIELLLGDEVRQPDLMRILPKKERAK